MTAARLYLRCLRWGLTTGALTGGGVGAVIGLLVIASGNVLLAVICLLAGAVYGSLVAVIPSVLGSLAVVVFLAHRHPQPASYDAVHRDLGLVFAAIVAVLDVAVLLWWLALGGLSVAAVLLIVLLLVNAAVVAVLKPARTSITRAWTGESAGAGVLSRSAPSQTWSR